MSMPYNSKPNSSQSRSSRLRIWRDKISCQSNYKFGDIMHTDFFNKQIAIFNTTQKKVEKKPKPV